ncbi:MAG TPA: 30S ribosomal protein S6 [Ruminococcaceae bacterium]|jgi:small subunit ribosomal protein S6|nr:30S ribosomal protein S6 [Oscillospiraceae bacterium]HCC02800.1 30S ribosomal protein S6 [Oscillospiraceae bacterium]HCM24887.1 30S ribosomal protein S6 [Oscillospiraceae bacterium]
MEKTKNAYETVFILSSKLDEQATAALVTKFKDLIAENGTVDGVDEWGKRRLAYEINKETEGYYVLINFTSVPSFTAELDRVFKITDGVMRSLIIRKNA